MIFSLFWETLLKKMSIKHDYKKHKVAYDLFLLRMSR